MCMRECVGGEGRDEFFGSRGLGYDILYPKLKKEEEAMHT